MTDPLTTAAGIAGVIALAGSVCKSFYQFFESIHDAPAVARDLASGLYALNAALSHIQGTLLDRRYVANVQDDQLKAWQECLADCTAAYLSVEERINDSGLASAKQSVPRKTWKSVKAFFTEKQMQDCLRSLESSKTTLLLISGNLQA